MSPLCRTTPQFSAAEHCRRRGSRNCDHDQGSPARIRSRQSRHRHKTACIPGIAARSSRSPRGHARWNTMAPASSTKATASQCATRVSTTFADPQLGDRSDSSYSVFAACAGRADRVSSLRDFFLRARLPWFVESLFISLGPRHAHSGTVDGQRQPFPDAPAGLAGLCIKLCKRPHNAGSSWGV